MNLTCPRCGALVEVISGGGMGCSSVSACGSEWDSSGREADAVVLVDAEWVVVPR